MSQGEQSSSWENLWVRGPVQVLNIVQTEDCDVGDNQYYYDVTANYFIANFFLTGKEQCWVSAPWESPSSWEATLCWERSYFPVSKEVFSCSHNIGIIYVIGWTSYARWGRIIIGGVGRMPSSQATHDGRNSPTVMNSTTLLGTLPSEVIVIVKTDHHFTSSSSSTLSSCFAFMITTMLIRFSDNIMTLIIRWMSTLTVWGSTPSPNFGRWLRKWTSCILQIGQGRNYDDHIIINDQRFLSSWLW